MKLGALQLHGSTLALASSVVAGAAPVDAEGDGSTVAVGDT
jgi:hypothetical protein